MWKLGGGIHKHWKQNKMSECTATLGVMKLFLPCVIFLIVFEGLGASMQCACVCVLRLGGDEGLCSWIHVYIRCPYLSTMKIRKLVKFRPKFQNCQVVAHAQSEALFRAWVLCSPFGCRSLWNSGHLKTGSSDIKNCFWKKSAIIPELQTNSVL